jgi:hypothetical protein
MPNTNCNQFISIYTTIICRFGVLCIYIYKIVITSNLHKLRLNRVFFFAPKTEIKLSLKIRFCQNSIRKQQQQQRLPELY